MKTYWRTDTTVEDQEKNVFEKGSGYMRALGYSKDKKKSPVSWSITIFMTKYRNMLEYFKIY